MKRAVLFYYSIHHGNTKKVVEAIAEKLPVRLVSVPVREEVDLNEYDLVGFASGIYFSAFGKPMERLLDSGTIGIPPDASCKFVRLEEVARGRLNGAKCTFGSECFGVPVGRSAGIWKLASPIRTPSICRGSTKCCRCPK